MKKGIAGDEDDKILVADGIVEFFNRMIQY
jgi:hypothetical protein